MAAATDGLDVSKIAAVALANKAGRMVWALMTSGERYREPVIA
jgi:transposase